MRQVVKEFSQSVLSDIKQLLESVYNEERLLGLLILEDQYKKAKGSLKEELFQFYMNNLQCV